EITAVPVNKLRYCAHGVLCLNIIDGETMANAGQDLGAVVRRELGVHGTRLDERHAHVAGGDLLAEGVAERADAMLGGVVDTAAAARLAPCNRADVDDIGDPPGTVLRRSKEVR